MILVTTLACTLMFIYGCGGVEGDESKDYEGQESVENQERLFEPEILGGNVGKKGLKKTKSCQQIHLTRKKLFSHFNDTEKNHRDEIEESVTKAAYYIVKYASAGETKRAHKIAVSAIRDVKEAGRYYQTKIEDDLIFGWKFTHKKCNDLDPVGVKKLRAELEKMKKEVDSNIIDLEFSAVDKLAYLVK